MTQKEKILNRLKQGTVTNIELNDTCFRYGARIHDLKQSGHDIRSRRVKQGVWEFWLANGEPKASKLMKMHNERVAKEKEEKEDLPLQLGL